MSTHWFVHSHILTTPMQSYAVLASWRQLPCNTFLLHPTGRREMMKLGRWRTVVSVGRYIF